MEVDWKEKWLSFMYQDKKVQLCGLQPDLSSCPIITAMEVLQLQAADQLWGIWKLFQLESHQISSSWPAELHDLINQFEEIFAKPIGLPPKRHINHAIHLIPGAQPFRLRPYRYNPAQKDKIETQVKELLNNGLIK